MKQISNPKSWGKDESFYKKDIQDLEKRCNKCIVLTGMPILGEFCTTSIKDFDIFSTHVPVTINRNIIPLLYKLSINSFYKMKSKPLYRKCRQLVKYKLLLY